MEEWHPEVSLTHIPQSVFSGIRQRVRSGSLGTEKKIRKKVFILKRGTMNINQGYS